MHPFLQSIRQTEQTIRTPLYSCLQIPSRLPVFCSLLTSPRCLPNGYLFRAQSPMVDRRMSCVPVTGFDSVARLFSHNRTSGPASTGVRPGPYVQSRPLLRNNSLDGQAALQVELVSIRPVQEKAVFSPLSSAARTTPDCPETGCYHVLACRRDRNRLLQAEIHALQEWRPAWVGSEGIE